MFMHIASLEVVLHNDRVSENCLSVMVEWYFLYLEIYFVGSGSVDW